VLPKAPQNLLNEPPKEYFECKREARFNMPLSQIEKEMAEKAPWEAAKQPIKELADLLKEQGGPFFLGYTGEWAINSVNKAVLTIPYW
jgi:hypothetical protein